jgi:hypothetical protein
VLLLWLQYIWVQVSGGFFKKTQNPPNEVQDRDIIKNEGGLQLSLLKTVPAKKWDLL